MSPHFRAGEWTGVVGRYMDGNGVLDVIGVPDGPGDVRVLMGFGDTSSRIFADGTSAYQLGSKPAYGITVTDIDGDADHDILLLRPEDSNDPEPKQFLWSNPFLSAPAQPGQERTLTVGFDPSSLTHNPLGIGATIACNVVTPEGESLWSSQVVDGGSGRGGQGAGRVAFGLAGASTAEIRVRWPHGGIQVFDAAAMPGFPNVLITNTTDPQIDDNSISWSYIPSTSATTHTFEWVTNLQSDEPQVRVAVANPITVACKDPLGGGSALVLKKGVAGVATTSASFIAGDGTMKYRHTLTWQAACAGGCNYTYKVRNVVGGEVYVGQQQTMNVSTCANIFEM